MTRYTFGLDTTVYVSPFQSHTHQASVRLEGIVVARRHKYGDAQYDVRVERYSTGVSLTEPVILKGITDAELSPRQ